MGLSTLSHDIFNSLTIHFSNKNIFAHETSCKDVLVFTMFSCIVLSNSIILSDKPFQNSEGVVKDHL